MAKDLYVGIDLGTTNSTAAVFDGDKTELVRNAQASPLTPSVEARRRGLDSGLR